MIPKWCHIIKLHIDVDDDVWLKLNFATFSVRKLSRFNLTWPFHIELCYSAYYDEIKIKFKNILEYIDIMCCSFPISITFIRVSRLKFDGKMIIYKLVSLSCFIFNYFVLHYNHTILHCNDNFFLWIMKKNKRFEKYAQIKHSTSLILAYLEILTSKHIRVWSPRNNMLIRKHHTI